VSWRLTQAESRARYLARVDAAEAARYRALVGTLDEEDEAAYVADLAPIVRWPYGASLLDAGAGTGALTAVLACIPGVSVTALEPAPAMLELLCANPRLRHVSTVEGFCDSADDRPLFAAGHFDGIVCRQLVNGLFDPLAAFANWHHWLKPGGLVIVIEGIYGRDAWAGNPQEEVDVFPVSSTQSLATVPYLLETAGLRVESVGWMEGVNRRPKTRTPRYLVVARKAAP
jgi:SAM-dependent methyltransferase